MGAVVLPTVSECKGLARPTQPFVSQWGTERLIGHFSHDLVLLVGKLRRNTQYLTLVDVHHFTQHRVCICSPFCPFLGGNVTPESERVNKAWDVNFILDCVIHNPGSIGLDWADILLVGAVIPRDPD